MKKIKMTLAKNCLTLRTALTTNPLKDNLLKQPVFQNPDYCVQRAIECLTTHQMAPNPQLLKLAAELILTSRGLVSPEWEPPVIDNRLTLNGGSRYLGQVQAESEVWPGGRDTSQDNKGTDS